MPKSFRIMPDGTKVPLNELTHEEWEVAVRVMAEATAKKKEYLKKLDALARELVTFSPRQHFEGCNFCGNCDGHFDGCIWMELVKLVKGEVR